MLHGIDISSWQKGIKPSELPIDFCIIKATEGVGYVNPYCDGWVQECIGAGKLWGFYHFARENDPVDEANYFIENTVDYFGYGVPVLDWECNQNSDWVNSFVRHVHERTGVWPWVYGNPWRFNMGNVEPNCMRWIAWYVDVLKPQIGYDPGVIPATEGLVGCWQYASDGQVPGYSGNLDVNVYYGDEESWLKYANPDGKTFFADLGETIKTVDELVLETILGEWGNGSDRKRMLGSRYDEVQKRVDELYDVANEVIRGDWGNGESRQKSLEYAGYPYDIVQRIVNDILG